MTTNKNSEASISPISLPPEMRTRILNDQKIEDIHQATLKLLENTGIRFPSEIALKTFADAGADVDFEKQVVKIPRDLLMENIAKAPRSYTMASRGNEALDFVLNGEATHMGTSGTGCATIDFETGEKRSSTKADVGNMAKITDYVSSCSFYWPMVSADDVPPATVSLHEIEASFLNTEKHVHIISCVKPGPAKYAVKMAQSVAGGKEAARKRPPLSVLICPVSPLNQDEAALEAGLIFAEAGLPVGIGVLPTLGSTGPATFAGLLVAGNAELLSTICYIQLLYPGAPVYYAFFSMTMNPYSGGGIMTAYCQHLLNAVGPELGHFYNLPVMSAFGGTDSTGCDTWKAGKDVAIEALLAYQANPDMIVMPGIRDSVTLLHYEALLMDIETLNSIETISRGIDVTEETLALDEIDRVGHGGHFLDSRLTLKNIRKVWTSGMAFQWDSTESVFRDPREAAREKTRWILENYEPKPLSGEVKEELKNIIREAEKELL
ncbi:MAG: trimethylamine methyltransferase family protein [Desulfobacterales bacterium]|nr:trimethylamine methyltransferase family protein [Desulfobacterales bacterium]